MVGGARRTLSVYFRDASVPTVAAVHGTKFTFPAVDDTIASLSRRTRIVRRRPLGRCQPTDKSSRIYILYLASYMLADQRWSTAGSPPGAVRPAGLAASR